MFDQMIKFIKDSHVFQKYFYNTGWVLLEKVIRIFLSFYITVLIARYLGPSDFGMLSFTLSFAALALPISNLGLDSILIKEFVQKRFSVNEILGTSFILRIVATLITNMLLFLGYHYFISNSNSPLVETLSIIILLGSNFFHIFNVLEFYFQSQVKYKLVGLSLTLSIFLTSILRIVLVYYKFELLWLVMSYFVEFFLLNVFLIYYASREKFFLKNWKWSSKFSQKILKEAWPLIFSSIMVSIYMKIDQVMIKDMLGDRDVGIYSTGIKLSEFFYFIPVALSRSINPLLTKNYDQDEKFFEHRLMLIMGIMFWAFLFIAIFLQYFSEPLILLLFGNSYLNSHEVLKVHGYAGMITGMSVFLSQRYILQLKNSHSFYGTVIGATSNLMLNLYLIPNYGPVGAAWSTVISYHIPTLFIGIFFDRKVLFLTLMAIIYPFKFKKYKV